MTIGQGATSDISSKLISDGVAVAKKARRDQLETKDDDEDLDEDREEKW